MQSDFFKSICQMGIFMICAQSIIHFRPKASYEKYLKMLVGVMLLIQLFWPVGRLFLGDGVQEFAGRVEEFEQSLEVSMQQAEENAAQSQKKLEQMTLEEVQTRLENQETEQKAGQAVPEENQMVQKDGRAAPEEGKTAPEEGEQGQQTPDSAVIAVEPVEPICIEAGAEEESEKESR